MLIRSSVFKIPFKIIPLLSFRISFLLVVAGIEDRTVIQTRELGNLAYAELQFD